MILYWVALGLAVPAGMGVQKLLDRLWPAQAYMPEHSTEVAVKTPARRELEFDDTMDVIGAAYTAGQRARPWALEPLPEFQGFAGQLPAEQSA